MALLLITHDLGVAAEMTERVAVMYAGRIVDQVPRKAFFTAPRHPYSRKLLELQPWFACVRPAPVATVRCR